MSEPEQPGALARAKASAALRFTMAKARHPSLRHTVAAWGRFQENNASQYAAAITYFSFLALFPLLLLAVAVTGFVLHSHPAAQQTLLDDITKNVPGSVGKTLSTSVKTAIRQRTGVGLVGLFGVLLTGLGWIGNLRMAIDAVWGTKPQKRNFVMAKVVNLAVLAGLGLGILLSLGLTAVGTALTDQILQAFGWQHLSGLRYVVKVVGILIGVAGDMIIFLWLLVWLPRQNVPRRIGLKGALLASVGFEVLKIVGTYTISKTAHSPTAGPFAGLLAVLIWIQLVVRWLLFCTAMTATLTEEASAVSHLEFIPAESPVEVEAVPEPTGFSPVAVAGSLLGVGAAAGAAAVAWVAHRREDDRRL